MDEMNLSDRLDQITSISLLEDLQSQETKVKINAIHNLKGISLALGEEATKKELLPYLKNCVNNEEEDEVLIELAKILSNFLDCIGGKQNIKDLLGLFEVILSIDEPTIRKEAINSLKETIQQIGNIKDIENNLMEIINKFYIVDDINQKLSALNIIILIYKDLNDNNKKIVLGYLDNFAINDNISIKKELLSEITKIINYLSIDYIKKFINIMLKDKNDSIKMDLLNVIISIKEHKDLLSIMDFIYELIPKLSEDQNWRVRLTVINNLSEILQFPNINYQFKQVSINIFIKLIEDNEVEIRNACCLKLEEVTKLLKNEINFNKILQNLQKLAKDPKNFVKISLSENIFKICPLLEKQYINEYIFTIFSVLINDENLDIRINLINNISQLSKIIDTNIILEKIIPSIVEISENKSWRVRNKIINIIPILSTKLFNQQIFMKDILPICLNYLTDHVFAIREGGCKLIANIYKDIKNSELENKLIEKMNEMSNSPNYLIRNTCGIFIKNFIEKINDKIYFDFFEKRILQIVFKLSVDKISNVRITCAIIFNKIKNCNFKDRNNKEKINKCIEILKKDEDKDVIHVFE